MRGVSGGGGARGMQATCLDDALEPSGALSKAGGGVSGILAVVVYMDCGQMHDFPPLPTHKLNGLWDRGELNDHMVTVGDLANLGFVKELTAKP
jgi:hypothetical protein